MNLHQAFQTFLLHLDLEREKAATHRLEQLAKAENLDNLLAVENLELGITEYSTTHGFRILCRDRPELNKFVVAKKGNGFAKARNLPYIYLQKCEPPQLIVESPSADAIRYGYATAVRLPYRIASKIDEYPEGTMLVCIIDDNQKSAAFCYANALPLPYSPDSVYVQKIDMLDTDYATMLVGFPRF